MGLAGWAAVRFSDVAGAIAISAPVRGERASLGRSSSCCHPRCSQALGNWHLGWAVPACGAAGPCSPLTDEFGRVSQMSDATSFDQVVPLTGTYPVETRAWLRVSTCHTRDAETMETNPAVFRYRGRANKY